MTMPSIDRRHHHEPLFDVHPVTGASVEVFYADRTLETFGRVGAGWFWWPRRRGFAPDGAARGPFPTSYSAYRRALERCTIAHNPGEVSQRLRLGADHASASMRQGAAEQIASEPARAAARALENQMLDEIAGIEVQRDARVSQIEWIKKELEGVNSLWKQNLVPYTRVTSLEREAARLEGERGQLISQIAQTREKIAQVDQDMRAEVGKDLGEIRGKISELLERKIAAEDQLKRVDIRAPQDGVVHQSNVHTVGGVINAGEPIMMVVPETDVLTVELKIEPKDIDQVHVGQAAALKFSAFNQRTTPEVDGALSMVSADVTQDQKTSAYFYTPRVSVSEDELAKLGQVKLVPGMPVEAFIRTGDRSVMSYLTRPLADQIARAFREK
jgi:HlyD family secretion protein